MKFHRRIQIFFPPKEGGGVPVIFSVVTILNFPEGGGGPDPSPTDPRMSLKSVLKCTFHTQLLSYFNRLDCDFVMSEAIGKTDFLNNTRSVENSHCNTNYPVLFVFTISPIY